MPLQRHPRDLRCNGLKPTPRGEAPYGVATYQAGDVPQECSELSGFARRGGDQLSTETCVAWSYAGAIWMLLGILGLPRVWASVLGMYYLTLAKTHDGDKSKIVDLGCRMPDAAAVLREAGFALDADWPFRVSKVCVEPPWKALTEGLRNDWLRPRRVLAYGAELEAIIKASLSAPGKAARPVIRGIRVDQPYLDWMPGDAPWELNSTAKGRHAELCATYDVESLGKVSSWGDTFERHESWRNVREDYDSETWIVDVDVEALVHNLKLMGVLR